MNNMDTLKNNVDKLVKLLKEKELDTEELFGNHGFDWDDIHKAEDLKLVEIDTTQEENGYAWFFVKIKKINAS